MEPVLDVQWRYEELLVVWIAGYFLVPTVDVLGASSLLHLT